MNNKKYFISFEGIDGSGKDTQLNELIKQIKENDNYPFKDKYSNIWITREPTNMTKSGNEISKKIRESNVSAKEATKLYIEDRKQHTITIKQILEHSHVLTSRYDISTLTYQMTQGIPFETLYKLHNFEKGECIIPDITLIFEIPAEIAFERIKKRGQIQECFERIEFLKKLVNIQKEVIKKLQNRGRNIIIINANQEIEKVTKEMFEKIANNINNKTKNVQTTI